MKDKKYLTLLPGIEPRFMRHSTASLNITPSLLSRFHRCFTYVNMSASTENLSKYKAFEWTEVTSAMQFPVRREAKVF
jgi:hypothetical protein